ncbi:alanine racemase [Enterovirga sp.]|uniref:alanine racemase n=1 Tax=Enterovirga sp. TaxID=2026350 RepID=UPI002C13E1A3|nr:alanine racemase [Enterovirga sp.]HMO29884.1 alanine racemase [Enterovirga sp.]
MSLSNRAPASFIDPTDPIRMDIDIAALKSNYRAVRDIVGPDIRIMASVKGNGYGAGAAPVAAALRDLGVHAVATGAIGDAMAIRNAGNDVLIHMFAGILPEALGVLHANNLTPTIYNRQLADAADEVASARRWKVFVKVDAGTGRLGVPIDEAERFILDVAKKPNLEIEAVFTHLPFAGDAPLPWINEHLQKFDELTDRVRRQGVEIPIRQSLASIHVIKKLETTTNAVCVGHLLFGGLGRFEPGDEAIAARFKPVHKSIRTRLIDARRYASDVTAGTSGKLSLKQGSMLGTVPIGLHEGYRPAAPGQQARMLIDGIRVPVISVSQEYTVLNLTDHPRAAVGDEVVALGESGEDRISIEEMAKWQGNSPLHVAMAMDRGFPKHYIY